MQGGHHLGEGQGPGKGSCFRGGGGRGVERGSAQAGVGEGRERAEPTEAGRAPGPWLGFSSAVKEEAREGFEEAIGADKTCGPWKDPPGPASEAQWLSIDL